MKHEHRGRGGAWRACTQGAYEPVEIAALQVLADGRGQFLDGGGRLDVLDGDSAVATLRESLGNLRGRVGVYIWQLIENATRRLASDDRPGSEREPLGGIARGDTWVGCHEREPLRGMSFGGRPQTLSSQECAYLKEPRPEGRHPTLYLRKL